MKLVKRGLSLSSEADTLVQVEAQRKVPCPTPAAELEKEQVNLQLHSSVLIHKINLTVSLRATLVQRYSR